MTVSFPLTPPTIYKHAQVEWIQNNFIGVGVSPFSAQQSTQDWIGDYWSIRVQFDVADRDEAAEWISFLSQLQGRLGTFYYGDILTAQPQGAAGGTPLVNGGSQVGHELNIDGCTPSVQFLKAGDKIQIDNSLYMNQKDVSANGSGECTLDLWPSLRGHANNAPIITANAKTVFRLTNNNIDEVQGRSKLWTIGFEATEAL